MFLPNKINRNCRTLLGNSRDFVSTRRPLVSKWQTGLTCFNSDQISAGEEGSSQFHLCLGPGSNRGKREPASECGLSGPLDTVLHPDP